MTTKLQEIWFVVLRRGRFFLGGLVVCSRGELGWERRRRNRGGEGQQSANILTFADGFTDEIISSVSPSAILTVNRACHCTDILVWIPRWFRRHFKRWIGHITVRSYRFESLGNSVGKITRKNLHVSEPVFFLILNILSVILAVNTDRMCYIPAEWRMEKISSVIVTSNYWQKYSVGNAVGIKRISGSARVRTHKQKLEGWDTGYSYSIFSMVHAGLD